VATLLFLDSPLGQFIH
jgi:hypothetical protein